MKVATAKPSMRGAHPCLLGLVIALTLGCSGSTAPTVEPTRSGTATPATDSASADRQPGAAHQAHPLMWQGDVLTFAPGYSYDVVRACLSAPFEGQTVELCDFYYSDTDEDCENGRCIPKQGVVSSARGVLAWRPPGSNGFCLLARDDAIDSLSSDMEHCFEEPQLGVSADLRRDPVFQKVTSTDALYLPYRGRRMATENKCYKWNVNVDRPRGSVSLQHAYHGREDGKNGLITVTHDIGFGEGIGTSYVWSAHFKMEAFRGEISEWVVGCQPEIGTLERVTDDTVVFDTMTWYRDEAACKRAVETPLLARVIRCK